MRARLPNLTAAERAAHERELARDRKREERGRTREAGRPDAAAIDRAVAEAVRSLLMADPQRLRPIEPAALMKLVAIHLLARSHRAYVTGGEPVTYTREGVEAALRARLLTPAKPVPERSKSAIH